MPPKGYRVIVEPDGDEFHAYCPAFKGLHVDGATVKEALSNATAAAEVYLNSLKNTQQKILYGITKSEKDAQVAAQDNKCAICHIEFDEAHKPETDHDHATKRVRGQLCTTCNVGLGMFQDNVETLAQAIVYLQKDSE